MWKSTRVEIFGVSGKSLVFMDYIIIIIIMIIINNNNDDNLG